MPQFEVKKILPKHRAVAQYLIAHPMATQRQVAEYFGVSVVWVGYVLRSEMFQEYLRELDAEIAEQVLMPLRQRLLGVATEAVEKLGEAVRNSQDPKFILEAADKTLHRLGYAPNRGPERGNIQQNVQQNNYYMADPGALARAREKMGQVAQQTEALPGLAPASIGSIPEPESASVPASSGEDE